MASNIPTTTTEAVAIDTMDHQTSAARRQGLSPTLTYILRRVGLFLITLWGSITASFLFFRLLPGDPIRSLVAQLEAQGQYATAEQTSEELVEFYQERFGLNGNLFEQYFRYMERVLLHFDFGPSLLSYPSPASDLIMRALPWTLGLIGAATVVGWLVGVLAGTFAGWARTSRVSEWVTNFSLLFSHIPAYFIALGFVYFLAYRNPIFPANSAYDASLQPGWSWAFILSVIDHGMLPMLATALVAATNWLLGTRALVITILGEDYLTYAGTKGLKPRHILTGYVMRNAWLPQITAIGIVMGGIINGNVLIERLFRYPGLGNLLVDAISVKDVNTALAIVTLFIVVVLTLNLIIDLALPLIDPRVKLRR